MSIEKEFLTVDLLIESDASTRAVDAFTISYIKAERQMRKLFTYLVYQSSGFSKKDIKHIKKVINEDGRLYFQHFIKGFDLMSPKSLSELIGEDYNKYLKDFERYKSYRHKIFHGQLTNSSLTRSDLEKVVQSVKFWCKLIAKNAEKEIGYDGFKRNSFRKSKLKFNLKDQIEDISDLKKLLKQIK